MKITSDFSAFQSKYFVTFKHDIQQKKQWMQTKMLYDFFQTHK